MANNPKIEVEIGAKINDLKDKLKETDNELKKTGNSFNKLNEFAVGALSGIAAAFTVSAVVNFGKAVLDTTAKFQKFEALLTNTLGSSSEAQLALIQIQDFASKTPFAVDELTNSFVKLANQGFKPTVTELRSLGDLAASTGKSFDQLTEAILDAQVGEFKRLKEFGIRAKKEGDNVTFTFKGVETQVKATDSAIRGYVLSLGDAEGVSGAMASISGTLGDKISNLGDNIEQLKLAIGDKTSGIFAASLDWLNQFVEATTRAAKGVAKIREEVGIKQLAKDLEAQKKSVTELAEGYQLLDPSLNNVQALAKAIATLKKPLLDAVEGGDAFFKQGLTLSELNERIAGFEDLAKELFSVSENTDGAKISLEEFSKISDQLNKEVFQKFAEDADLFNKELTETLRLQSQIASISESIVPTLGDKPIMDFGVDVGDGPPVIEIPDIDDSEFTQFLLGLQEVKSEFEAFGGDFQNAVAIFASNINAIIRDNLGAAFTDLGQSIGEALANGTDVIDAIGDSLLRSMARFLGDFGQQLIAVGVAGLAFSSLLETIKKGGPAAIPASILAIAAGTALVALSSGLQAKAGAGLGGGGGGVSGVGTSGIIQGTNFTGQGQGATGFNRDLTLRTEIDMDRLVFYIDQAKAAQI